MTNRRKNNASKKPKRAVKPKLKMARSVLDSNAMLYARLLRDPCNGPIVPSIWPGAEGSLVTRFETDFIAFNGATETGGILVFNPGLGLCYQNSTTITADTTATQLKESAPSPGSAFITNTAGSFRCVAACAQIMYAGTELNRAGFLGAGVTTFGTYAQHLMAISGGSGFVTTTGLVRQACQRVVRMPDDMLEVLWYPSGGDQNFVEVNNTSMTPADVVDSAVSKNCIQISVSGLPVSTGVRIRFVSVLEWTPRPGQGLISSMSMPRSRNTVNDVLSYLGQAFGETWFLNLAKAGLRQAAAHFMGERRIQRISY